MQEVPKRTILYGGAFNPPTKAHAAIVRGLAEIARSDDSDLWLMPSGDRHDKVIATDLGIRTAYLYALLASGETHGVTTHIETYELELAEPTETYATHRHLSQRYPDREFAWVFGSDSVNTMRQWRRGSWLLEHLDLIIIERPGYELSESPRRHQLLKLGEMAVSSTDVRRRILEGSDIEDLVPLPVIGVLKQNGALNATA